MALTRVIKYSELSDALGLIDDAIVEANTAAANADPNIPTVSSVAQLKAIDVTGLLTGTRVDTLGYYSSGDGGANQFYYDGASVATDNSGTIIAPNTGSGRWLAINRKRINSMQFGILPNEPTSQHTLIQKAYNAIEDGTVFTWYQGVYVCHAVITIPRVSNILIDGTGCIIDNTNWVSVGTSMLFGFDTTSAITESKVISSITGRNIVVASPFASTIKKGQWLSLRTNELVANALSWNRPSYFKSIMVQVESVSGATITITKETSLPYTYDVNPLNYTVTLDVIDFCENVTVRGFTINLYDQNTNERTQGGIAFNYCLNYNADSNIIRGITRQGVGTTYSVNGRITRNTLTDAKNKPIINDSEHYGVFVRFSSYTTVADNTVESVKGIDGEMCYHTQVTGNACNGSIRTHGSLYWNIVGNTFGGNSLIFRSGFTKISNNTIYATNSTNRGISFAEMAQTYGNLTVTDNYIENKNDDNLFLDGSDAAIMADSSTISDLVFCNNVIKKFKTGIIVDGEASGVGNNVVIKGNVIDCYVTGINCRRKENTFIHDNVIRLLTSATVDTTRGIVNTGDKTFPILNFSIKDNSIIGAFDEGILISVTIEDYPSLTVSGNYFSQDVTTKINTSIADSPSDISVANIKQPANVNKNVYYFDESDDFDNTKKIVITAKGGTERDIDYLKVTFFGSRKDTSVADRKVVAIKEFFLAVTETGFALNNTTDVKFIVYVTGEVTVAHSGSNYTYAIDIDFPAGTTATEFTNAALIIETASTRKESSLINVIQSVALAPA